MRFELKSAALLLVLTGAWSPAACQEASWPDLSSPLKAAGGGEKDAAVIVGVENYLMVSKVPGARRNAEEWHAYLTDTLKVPSDQVSLLRDNEATLEKMRRFAAQAAGQVGQGGTLWFVFIGHGAPTKDGKDGLLVGADAQQDPDGLYARSLARGELLGLLSKGKQAKTVVLIDACFSGRSSTGESLVPGLQPLVLVGHRPAGADPRTVLMTAAKSDQFAGPLPKASQPRPAFSYLALGALRGWAADEQGKVTASAIVEFARRALTLDKGRTQTPELTAGSAGTVLGRGRETGPDLGKIDRASGAAPQTAGPAAAPKPSAEPSARGSISASVDKTSVAVNEAFELQVSVSGTGASEFALPDMAPFVVEASGRSTGLSLNAGKMVSTTVFKYRLYAERAGSAVIPPLALGPDLKTEPIEITVRAPDRPKMKW